MKFLNRSFKLPSFTIIFIWLIFSATSPFIFYKLIPHHPYKVLVLIGLVLILFIFQFKGKIKGYNKIVVAILLIQTVYAILMAFYQQYNLGFDFKYLNLALQFVSDLLLYLFITSYYSVEKVIISNIQIIAFMCIGGVIVFFLVLGGYLHPFSIFRGPTWITKNYLLTVTGSEWNAGGITVMRVAGYFDEPGTFAFYITFALILNKLFSYSKKVERILIICGLVTFSVAFFISIVLYLILFYFSMKSIKYFALFFILGAIGLNYILKIKEESKLANTIYKISLGRLEINLDDESKVINGDTRTVVYEQAKIAFLDAPVFGHGLLVTEQPKSIYYNAFFGANILAPFAYHGIVGTLVFYAMYFYWTFITFFNRRKLLSRSIIAAWLIISINFFQRPDAFIGTYGYLVIIFLVYGTLYKYHSIDIPKSKGAF